MSLNPEMTIADIVLEHPECARVFGANKIDFCCGGKVTVAHACEARGLDFASIWSQLQAAVERRASGAGARDYRAMSTPALLAHVIERHHGYLREAMPQVRAMADKVARVHGERNPKLVELDRVVQRLVATLEAHLDREERVLFPALMTCTGARADAALREELATMHRDHEDVGAALARIRTLADEFSPPSWACTTYRTLLRELETMEGDIHQHVHIENNVVMPRYTA